MKFRVEGNDEAENHFSPVEKLWSIPLYIVRKVVLYLCISCVVGVDHVSNWFGFHYHYELEDQSRWKWMENFSLPRYTLRRKK